MRFHVPARARRAAAILLLSALTGSVVGAPVALGADGDVGTRGPAYGSSVSAPTAEKPESKLWHHDGRWWGVLWDRATAAFRIHRLDGDTWVSTGVAVDERTHGQMDVLSAGSKLYVATHGTTASTESHGGRVLRYSYDTGAHRYTLDAGFPVAIMSGGVESMVIERDTTGRLWVVFVRGATVHVAHSDSSDTDWTAPEPLAVPEATGIDLDDAASIVAFDGRIGVMWSDQKRWAFHFATHRDGAPPGEWTTSRALQQTGYSDDHLNVKTLRDDPAGKVFAVVKTSRTSAADPLILLLVLRNDGTWARHTVATVADNHTRPQVVIDQGARKLSVFLAGPCCSGGTIYRKETSLDAISFAPGPGTPVIRSGADTKINNPSTTKQVVSSATGVVVLAGDDGTRRYLHHAVAGASQPPTVVPETTITSGPTGTVSTGDASFGFSSDVSGASFQCALDGGAWVSCASPRSYSDLPDGTHTFGVRAVSGSAVDASPATRTWTVARPDDDGVVFADGFESGTFGTWTVRTRNTARAVVQSALAAAGAHAARFTSSSDYAYARRSLPVPAQTFAIAGAFRFASQGTASVPYLKLWDGTGASVVTVLRKPDGRIQVTVNSTSRSTTTTLPFHTWVRSSVRVVTRDSGSSVEVRVNGTLIHATTAASISGGIRTFQVGSSHIGAFDQYADEVSVTD